MIFTIRLLQRCLCLSVVVLTGLTGCSLADSGESTSLPVLTFENYHRENVDVSKITLEKEPVKSLSRNETAVIFPVSPLSEFNTYMMRRFKAAGHDQRHLTIGYNRIETEIIDLKNTKAGFFERMAEPFAGRSRYSIGGQIFIRVENCSGDMQKLTQIFDFQKTTELSNYLSAYERDEKLLRLVENTIHSFDAELVTSVHSLVRKCGRGQL